MESGAFCALFAVVRTAQQAMTREVAALQQAGFSAEHVRFQTGRQE